MIYQNRKQAGQLLAKELIKYRNKNVVVLALPRGGVPVAAEVANTLHAPLDVLIVRKIGAPFNSELAVGAISENGKPFFKEHILARLGLEPDNVLSEVRNQFQEVERRKKIYRKGRELISLENKIVIVVDDGLATGATMEAAIKYLKTQHPEKIIAAIPVAASDSSKNIKQLVNEVVILQDRDDLLAISEWYDDFTQVTDEEVVSILNSYSILNSEIDNFVRQVSIQLSDVSLEGQLTVFPKMKAIIIFAHGSGSSRKSPRNMQVASDLNSKGFGTLLFDLLTEEESVNRKNVFDIDFLSKRLVAVTNWLQHQNVAHNVPIGFFGASTGAAAALKASALLSEQENVYAIVSRGGRPDLAGDILYRIKVPTLLLVGGLDDGVIELNEEAHQKLEYSKLSIIKGATHLFEEPGTLEEVSQLAADWFSRFLKQKNAQNYEYVY